MSYETEGKELIEKFIQKNEEIIRTTEVKGYDGELAIKMKELDDEFKKCVKELRKKYNLS